MSFKYDFADQLEVALKKIYKKDKSLCESVLNKIAEISSRDKFSIDFYKNLKNDLKDYKRVHIMKSFVLLFRVFKDKNFMLFYKLAHHDDVYKK